MLFHAWRHESRASTVYSMCRLNAYDLIEIIDIWSIGYSIIEKERERERHSNLHFINKLSFGDSHL